VRCKGSCFMFRMNRILLLPFAVILANMITGCQAPAAVSESKSSASLAANSVTLENIESETAAPLPTADLSSTPIVSPQESKMKTILTLGDSYTIGTGISADERWPVQLAAALRGQGIPAAEPAHHRTERLDDRRTGGLASRLQNRKEHSTW
jgi:hypothetical protein